MNGARLNLEFKQLFSKVGATLVARAHGRVLLHEERKGQHSPEGSRSGRGLEPQTVDPSERKGAQLSSLPFSFHASGSETRSHDHVCWEQSLRHTFSKHAAD